MQPTSKSLAIWFVGIMLLAAAPQAHAAPSVVPPPGGTVWQIAGSSPTNLYAATDCGVYTFTGEDRWQAVEGGGGFPARTVVRLNGGVVLATTNGFAPGGIWRHAPGETWQRVLDVLSMPLAVAADDTTVYGVQVVGSNAIQVVRSTDTGRTWSPTSSTTLAGFAPSIAVVRNRATGKDEVLLPLSSGRGATTLLRSTDEGRTWQDVSAPTNAPMSPLYGTLFADNAESRVFVATLLGASPQTRLFEVRLDGSPAAEVVLADEMAASTIVDVVSDADRLLVGTLDGVYASVTTGETKTWQRFDTALGLGTLYDLQRVTGGLPGSASRYFAATSAGVYGFDSRTSAWYAVAPGLPACGSPGRTVYDPVDPFTDSTDRRFFPQTGHTLSYEFKRFWETSGGLAVFGYPLSEEFDERNADLQRAFTTQYFERERLEFHPENADTPYLVLLGRLGSELLAAQGRDWRSEDGTDDPFGSGTCDQFTVGGEARSVCGPFREYWHTHGLDLGVAGTTYEESLALFGLPLTAPKIETNPDGDRVLTQWFERARFESHPDKPAVFQVLLGRLGDEILEARGQ